MRFLSPFSASPAAADFRQHLNLRFNKAFRAIDLLSGVWSSDGLHDVLLQSASVFKILS